jgi:hypothetical protein
MINIQALIDDAKCFETVRALRWPDGVRCPGCGSAGVPKDGHDDTQPQRQRLCQWTRTLTKLLNPNSYEPEALSAGRFLPRPPWFLPRNPPRTSLG